MNEDYRRTGGPGLAGNAVDTDERSVAVKCRALTLAKALLYINDKYGSGHGGVPDIVLTGDRVRKARIIGRNVWNECFVSSVSAEQ